MTIEGAKLGHELVQLIDIQKQAIKDLGEVLLNVSKEDRDDQRILDDKCYQLSLSQYDDGSGWALNLSRYFGNTALLDAIMIQMKKELKSLEDKLKEL